MVHDGRLSGTPDDAGSEPIRVAVAATQQVDINECRVFPTLESCLRTHRVQLYRRATRHRRLVSAVRWRHCANSESVRRRLDDTGDAGSVLAERSSGRRLAKMNALHKSCWSNSRLQRTAAKRPFLLIAAAAEPRR